MSTTKIVTLDSIAPPIHVKAGMSLDEWRDATRFDQADWNWMVVSFGMAIGAGIVFLPVMVGAMGLWTFLLSSVIGYPAMYMFQKLFINTLAESKTCKDYTSVISGYLGNNWGIALGILYFVMLAIWMLVYSLAVTNDSASYLQSFGVTDTLLSDNIFYGLVLISGLAFIGAKSEKLLFRISGFTAVTVLVLVLAMSIMLISMWDFNNIAPIGDFGTMLKDAIITLPFTLTSILFIQSLSPMVIAYRSQEKSIEVARFKALRAMNYSFIILFVIVFFFAISFTFALSQEQAIAAMNQNVSALAILGTFYQGSWITWFGVIINIFAIVSSFMACFIGFREACKGITMNLLQRKFKPEEISEKTVDSAVVFFTIILCWSAVIFNAPILSFTSLSSPIFGMVGCLIPAYLVHKMPHLHRFKGAATNCIIVTGVLLCISPFLAFS